MTVSRTHPDTSPFDVADVRHRVNIALETFLDSRAGHIADVGGDDLSAVLETIRKFVLSGGKRIRPVMCYWGWRGAGGPDCEEIVTAAASLELFHAFGLIHDDIIDSSEARRGHPTVHRTFASTHAKSHWRGEAEAFGTAIAIIVGDLCLFWSNTMFHACGLSPQVLLAGDSVLDAMRADTFFGEFLEIMDQARGAYSAARAATISRYKTGKYTVEYPLKLGAVLAGAGAELLAAYSQFGTPLGEAFQLRDDVLGVFGDPTVTGKSNLDDLYEGKPTMLMAFALERANAGQAELIKTLHGSPVLDEHGAGELRRVMVETGALASVEELISRRTEQALKVLAATPVPDPTRSVLTALATAVTDRGA